MKNSTFTRHKSWWFKRTITTILILDNESRNNPRKHFKFQNSSGTLSGVSLANEFQKLYFSPIFPASQGSILKISVLYLADYNFPHVIHNPYDFSQDKIAVRACDIAYIPFAAGEASSLSIDSSASGAYDFTHEYNIYRLSTRKGYTDVRAAKAILFPRFPVLDSLGSRSSLLLEPRGADWRKDDALGRKCARARKNERAGWGLARPSTAGRAGRARKGLSLSLARAAVGCSITPQLALGYFRRGAHCT